MADFRKPVVPRRIWWVVIIGAMIALMFAMHAYKEAPDNDMWWLFANGHEILENGFPYINPFSVYDDMHIVIQQWIPSVVAYLAYSAGGNVGIGIVVLALTMAVYGAAVMLGFVADDGKRLGIYSLLAGLLVGGCMAYISIRPHLYSMLAYLLVLTVMEKYRKTDNVKYLFALPLISFIHANAHLSMMPFDLFIVACFLIPSIPKRNCAGYVYRRLPIVFALMGMALVSLVNPYGIDGVLYLVNSYDAASYKDYIVELGTTDIWCWYGFYCVVWILLGALALGLNRMEEIDWPLSVFFIVCLVLSLQHTRNVWLVTIAGFALLACAVSRSGFSVGKYARFMSDDIIKIGVATVGSLVIVASGFVYGYEAVSKTVSDSTRTPVAAVDYLDSHVEDKSSAKVFTHFNAGGYLEYRGYKVGMDARPELWQSVITGLDKDYYTEYVDMSKNDITLDEYLADKDFDYLVVNTDTRMYTQLNSDEHYKTVVTGDEYVLFEKSEKAASAI